MKTHETAKIVLVDIETAPSLGWTWGPKWETSIIDFKTDWYLLSFAYKVLGEKKVTVKALNDYPGYSKNKENDEALVADLWEVFNGADILLGHNLDKFDIRKANARFLTHGMPPPAPYKTLDTLKIARRSFKFDSSKLDDLGHYLGLGRKLPHTGFHLWRGCMDGDLKSWNLMKRYNAQDVTLLEKVYYAVRAWSSTHPNVNKGVLQACPKCGSKNVQRRGFEYTALRQKQRYQCLSCHGWHSGPARKVD
jgi:hypothetical protein